MGKLDPNNLIGILQGKIGDLVFAEGRDGKVTVRHRPVRKAPYKTRELGNQSLFAGAAAYVKRVRQQPELYAVYSQAAKDRGKRWCEIAHADFRHPPEIHDIDVSEYKGGISEPIRVKVVDDFQVVAVDVVIANLQGVVIEQGPALLDQRAGLWVYRASVAAPPAETVAIHVNAGDRPGNVVTKSLDHSLLSLRVEELRS